jgi:hypothetical protein
VEITGSKCAEDPVPSSREGIDEAEYNNMDNMARLFLSAVLNTFFN